MPAAPQQLPYIPRCHTALGTAFLVAISAGIAAADYNTDVRPLLQKHCFGCHGEEKQKGKLRLNTLSPDLLNDRPAAETWHDVLDVLNLGEMPPE